MPRQRSTPRKSPSRIQGQFLSRFEDVYFGVPDRSETTLEEAVASARKTNPGFAASFSRSTYHSWKRQDTSPSLHDLEILCRVIGERQTLIVEPSQRTLPGDDDMEWLEEADSLIAQMGNLSPHQRSAVLGELRVAIRNEFAKAGQRNPQESDAGQGPTGARPRK